MSKFKNYVKGIIVFGGKDHINCLINHYWSREHFRIELKGFTIIIFTKDLAHTA